MKLLVQDAVKYLISMAISILGILGLWVFWPWVFCLGLGILGLWVFWDFGYFGFGFFGLGYFGFGYLVLPPVWAYDDFAIIIGLKRNKASVNNCLELDTEFCLLLIDSHQSVF